MICSYSLVKIKDDKAFTIVNWTVLNGIMDFSMVIMRL